MGFERIVKVFTLEFPDGKYEGLEVKMRSLTTDQFLDVTELADFARGKKAFSESTAELRKLCGWVAENMRSWNLEDDGVPVPVTLAALMDQEFEFVLDIVNAWLTGLGGTPPPFARELERFRQVAGGVDSHGRPLAEPFELTRARTLLGLMKMQGCTLAEAKETDPEIFRLVDIVQRGTPERGDDE